MHEWRAKEKAKNEGVKVIFKLQRYEQKAAKDHDKANVALNTADLTVPESRFMVGSRVKSKVNTLPSTNSDESELVEGNVIYK